MAKIWLLGSSLIDSGPGHRGYDVFDKFIILSQLLGYYCGIFCPSPRDKMIFIKGGFARCPRVFPTLRVQLILSWV